MAKARKKKIDFTGVESFVKAEEGEHIAVIKEIEEKTAQSGSEMLVAIFEITKGVSEGARIYENFVLTEKALWKLKSYLDVIGLKAEGRVVLDIDKMLNKPCIIEVTHEEYNGATRARIDGYKELKAVKSKEADVEEDEEFEEDDWDEA